jgi:putative transposase
MSYTKIWVHLVFSTKNREPLLTKQIRQEVCKHIAANCKEKGISLKAVNGYTDHLHCLILLGREQDVSKVSELIKGESAFWINHRKLTVGDFFWQDEYFAVSIGESQVQAMVNYINNQEQHHMKKAFKEEVKELMDRYGWGTMSVKN